MYTNAFFRNTGSVNQTTDADDVSMVSCGDNTLAREREELFARLDQLNREPVGSLTKETVSQTVAHLIQSAARSGNLIQSAACSGSEILMHACFSVKLSKLTVISKNAIRIWLLLFYWWQICLIWIIDLTILLLLCLWFEFILSLLPSSYVIFIL